MPWRFSAAYIASASYLGIVSTHLTISARPVSRAVIPRLRQVLRMRCPRRAGMGDALYRGGPCRTAAAVMRAFAQTSSR